MLTPSIVTFIASETILAGCRVKFSAGSVVAVELADAGDVEIGTAILHSGQSSYAAGSGVAVQLVNTPGSRTCNAAGAFAAGATLRRMDNDLVDDAGAGDIFGIALEAAADAGDLVDVLCLPGMLVTPADGSVTAAKLAGVLAGQIFSTTAAIANTGTPDGVAHITGQVRDVQGNALAGRFAVSVYLAATAYGAPAAQGGTSAALANSRILVADVANCLLQVLTHSDGSWGVEFTSAAGAETVHAHATVTGSFATASAAITGN